MKSFLVLIILIFLTACTNTRYYYYPENYKNSDISISASLVKFDNESSPLSYIWIYDLRNHYRNRERESYHNIKILSSTVKINSNGKENIVHTKSDSDHIYIYDLNQILYVLYFLFHYYLFLLLKIIFLYYDMILFHDFYNDFLNHISIYN